MLQIRRRGRRRQGGGWQGRGAEEIVVASSVVLAVSVLGFINEGSEARLARTALVVAAREAELG
jgi:hypothetical protein